jgi:uncharacterized protein (DUF2336 family)
MAYSASLISDLEEVIQHGSLHWRAETLTRIANLFADGASRYANDHVAVFGDVFDRLLEGADINVRADLSHRLAEIANAPAVTVCRLAHDSDPAVAAPVLRRSAHIPDDDLIEIIETGSQAHRLAIARRAALSEPVADRLVTLGDREVLNTVLENPAVLPPTAFVILMKRAKSDAALTARIGERADIPTHMLQELAIQASDIARRQFQQATTATESRPELRREPGEPAAPTALMPRTVQPAYGPQPQRFRSALAQPDRETGAPSLMELARSGQHEDILAGLSAQCAVPIHVVDRLMRSERLDPILVLCKAGGLAWPTVRAVIEARPKDHEASLPAIEAAQTYYERLAPATARRVLRFWQVQPSSLDHH